MRSSFKTAVWLLIGCLRTGNSVRSAGEAVALARLPKIIGDPAVNKTTRLLLTFGLLGAAIGALTACATTNNCVKFDLPCASQQQQPWTPGPQTMLIIQSLGAMGAQPPTAPQTAPQPKCIWTQIGDGWTCI